jgi:prepilin-type N-terminal cleavage/methylation domain-containing protein
MPVFGTAAALNVGGMDRSNSYAERSRAAASLERGFTLLELMIALVVIAVGVLAVAQLFPAGSRTQLQSRLLSNASYYAQQKVEQLSLLSWTDAGLSNGRHPGPTAFDTLGAHREMLRFYQVETLNPPLDELKKVTVTVTWRFQQSRSTIATTYVRKSS